MKRIFSTIVVFIISFNVFAQTNVFEKRDGKIYNSNKLFSGLYTVNNQDVKVSDFEIKDGVEHGKVTHFYPTSAVKEIGFYSNGKKDGKWEKWDTNNNKIGEASYNNGLKSGTWFVWDHQGTKRNQMSYTGGKRSGTWKMWDDTGRILQEKKY